MEVSIWWNLWSSTRSGFGAYRYRLLKMSLVMLSNRLILLHRRLRLRHCEIHSAKLGDLLWGFHPPSMEQGSTHLQLRRACIQQFFQPFQSLPGSCRNPSPCKTNSMSIFAAPTGRSTQRKCLDVTASGSAPGNQPLAPAVRRPTPPPTRAAAGSGQPARPDP
jgi:hypothetical protein